MRSNGDHKGRNIVFLLILFLSALAVLYSCDDAMKHGSHFMTMKADISNILRLEEWKDRKDLD